ncbi:MAG: hypothetical protein IJ714_01830 [Bacteroidales bacterium]|nr:hypothetical protein [Bacteroidales bacterium]
MFAVKRERTGRILKATFDHETTVLSTHKKQEEAEAEIRSRFKAQHENYGERASFTGNETDFNVTIKEPDYDVTEHFFIDQVEE